VYASGTFRIVNGTVYGSNESNTNLNNTAGSGAALYAIGTASQRGTFSDTMWNSAGTLTTTNDTIKVAKGELQ